MGQALLSFRQAEKVENPLKVVIVVAGNADTSLSFRVAIGQNDAHAERECGARH